MVDELLIKNLAWIKRMSMAFCKNRCDAEDLAGDTILKVLANKDRYDPTQSFRLWVLVIMRNTFCLRIRHSGIVVTLDKLPDSYNSVDPCSFTIASEAMDTIKNRLKDCISVRTACLYAQGYSYKEIADQQGVSVNIVKSRIHQGRKLIGRHLD